MNIEIALKSRSYILDLDRGKLPFFLLAFRIYHYFCQKHTPKSHKFYVSPNFTCGKGSFVVP